jgi:hypothetical protein
MYVTVKVEPLVVSCSRKSSWCSSAIRSLLWTCAHHRVPNALRHSTERSLRTCSCSTTAPPTICLATATPGFWERFNRCTLSQPRESFLLFLQDEHRLSLCYVTLSLSNLLSFSLQSSHPHHNSYPPPPPVSIACKISYFPSRRIGSCYNSEITVIRLRAGRPGFDFRQKQRYFSLRHRVQTGSGAQPASYRG